jgi:hypothetical protein
MRLSTLEAIAARVAGSPGKIRTAGKIEFVKDSGPLRRDIRAPGFIWSQDAMRNLAKVLWASQRAHSYSMAAWRVFSKMHSSSFSPDGLLGGRGYIQAIKDMRTGMSQVAEVLSSFSDTINDELNADHWKAVPQNGVTGDLVQDAQEVKNNPDQFVEEEYAEVAPEDTSEYEVPIANPNPEEFNPEFESDSESNDEQSQTASTKRKALLSPLEDRPDYGSKKKKKPEDEEPGSMLPSDTSEQPFGKTESEIMMHTVTPDHGSYATAFYRALRRLTALESSRTASTHRADTSVPVETLPGPRIDHIGPGEGNDAGHYNDGEEWPSDDPTGDGLSSGVNDSVCLLEDVIQDGVSPYSNPTDGDDSVLKISSRIARQNYSWLPGSSNSKNLNYYDFGITDEDMEWMRDHSDPDPPEGPIGDVRKNTAYLWEVEF